MGIGKIFTHSADLGGLLAETDTGGAIKVSKVVHKAFIEINEEGSEAVASTGQFSIENFCIFFNVPFKESPLNR